MSWALPGDYKPRSDRRLREIVAQLRLVPRSTAFRIYQVVIHRREPVAEGSKERPGLDVEEFTPAQARLALKKRWVPARWILRFISIAQSDGENTLPQGED